MGGSFIVLHLDPRTAHVPFGHSSQIGAVVGASLACIAAGLIFSYVVWRIAGRTRSAAAIGCAAGLLLLIGLDALSIRKGEHDRREQAARDELDKNERVVEDWRKMLEQQGGTPTTKSAGPVPAGTCRHGKNRNLAPPSEYNDRNGIDDSRPGVHDAGRMRSPA